MSTVKADGSNIDIKSEIVLLENSSSNIDRYCSKKKHSFHWKQSFILLGDEVSCLAQRRREKTEALPVCLYIVCSDDGVLPAQQNSRPVLYRKKSVNTTRLGGKLKSKSC